MENNYAAYCLDEAVIHYGEALEAELERVSDKAKTKKAAEGAQKLILEKWLALPGDKKSQQYATPVATKRR